MSSRLAIVAAVLFFAALLELADVLERELAPAPVDELAPSSPRELAELEWRERARAP